MKNIVKKVVAILGGVIVLLIIALFITAKVNDKTIWAQLGAISGKTKVAIARTFGNNSKYRIKVDGVLDQDGNIAAQGKSIPITADLMGGSSLGVIGTLKDGKLDIVLPPLADAHDSGEEIYGFNNLDLELSNITNDDDYVHFWFFKERVPLSNGTRSPKGWNFITSIDKTFYIKLNFIPKDYKWVYYGE